MWAFMSGFCHVGTCINFVIIVLKVIRKKPSWLRPQPLRGCPRGMLGMRPLEPGSLAWYQHGLGWGTSALRRGQGRGNGLFQVTSQELTSGATVYHETQGVGR